MAKLSIGKLKDGMTTNSEVVDIHGHTLIRSNELLTEKHITLLKMWGIHEIDVKDSINGLDIEHLKSLYPASVIGELQELAEKKLKFLNSDDKITSCLKKLFVEYSAKGVK